MQRISLFLITSMITIFLTACGGGGGSSTSTNSGNGDSTPQAQVMTDSEVIAISRTMIADIESESSTAQRTLLENVKDYVSSYTYIGSVDTQQPRVNSRADNESYTIEPRDPAHLYNMIGVAALTSGSTSGALWASLNAIQLEPNNENYLSQVGTILNELQRYDEALLFLDKAKDEDEDDAITRFNMAVSYAAKGSNYEGITEGKASIRLEPNNFVLKHLFIQLFLRDNTEALALEDAANTVCLSDLVSAAVISNSAALANYTMTKSNEMGLLLTEFTSLPQPMDLPADFFTEFDTINVNYQNSLDSVITQLSNDLLNISAYADSQYLAASNEQVACNIAAYGTTGYCACARNLCTADNTLLQTGIYPPAYEAARNYFNDSMQLLKQFEVDSVSSILMHQGTLSPTNSEWAYQYLFLNVKMQCKTIALGFASSFSPPFAFQNTANTDCQAAMEWCEAADDQEMEDTLRWIEEERQKEAERLEKAARAAAKAKEENNKGELCIDSVACLGINGSQFSVKIGAGLFAQFTVDTSNLELGVRVGAGISDPSGGNLYGADLSIGGTISTSGTTFNVLANQSYSAGMYGDSYRVFNRSFNF